MRLRHFTVALLIGAALLLGSCSGGGGSNPPSNQWDSMIWDQGSWG